MMGTYVPTWKLILYMIKELLKFMIPVGLVFWLVISLMKFIGDLPY